MAITATRKEDRKVARAAFARCLLRISNGLGHARNLDDAADYGIMSGMKISKIISDMVKVGINPDDAAISVLRSPQGK